MTALHWTALNGDLETMNVLLYAGATTGAVDARRAATRRCTWRARSGQAAVVSRLLEAGSKPGPVTETGVQPIHLAAQAGSADAVKALIDRGADVNASDATHGRTPLVLRRLAESARRDEGAAREGRGRPSRDERHRLPRARAADNQARQARDRIVSATTGRATNSNINLNDPPPTAPRRRRAARARRGRRRSEAAARGRRTVVDPNDPAGGRRARARRRAGWSAAALGHRADRPSGRLHRAALRGA